VLSQIVFGAALGLLAGLLDVLISRGLVRRPQPAPRDRRAERAAVLDALASGCRTAEDVADETGLTRLAVDDALAGLAGAGLVGVSAGRVSEVGRGRDVRRYRVVGLAPLTAAGRARVDRELAEAARRARERTWRRRGSFPRLEN
jgi:predicted ArsR family transcriptional regulator